MPLLNQVANSFCVLPLLSALAQELRRRNLAARIGFSVYLLDQLPFVIRYFPELLGNIVGRTVFAYLVIVEIRLLLLLNKTGSLERILVVVGALVVVKRRTECVRIKERSWSRLRVPERVRCQ